VLTGERTVHASCPCGWEGRYTTAGYATKAKAGHSCDTDYAPRACRQDKPHAHGTAAHYKHCGCRCWPCREAILDQYERSTKARAYGRQRLVDAEPARQHVRALMDAGMGWPRLVELSGLDGSVLIRLVWGKKMRGHREVSKRITRETEAALLAVNYDPADGSGGIDAETTVRRVRALTALGWWPSELARITGMNRDIILRLLHGQPKVRPGTARRVHMFYNTLAQADPPFGTYADRARRQAAERGWAPPLRIAGRLLSGQAIEMPEPKRRRAA
jgi:hypothetical protein